MAMREINHAYFVSIRRGLCLIEEHAWWADQVLAQLQLYITDLRFLERFSVWVAEKDYEDSVISKRLGCVWREEGKELTVLLSQVRGGYITDWNELASHLKQKIQDSKPLIVEWCKGTLLTIVPLHILLDVIINNLNDLLTYKACKNAPLNDQIGTLEEKLVYLLNFLNLNAKCIYNQDFNELKNRIHIFANNAACQSFLYWVHGAAETDHMLSDMKLRIKPCMPDVMASYFPTLKYMASTSDDIVRYIDAILNSLKHLVSYKAAVIVPFNKQIETLEQKLVFLQNFLKLASNSIKSIEFLEFMISVHDFSENAASLTVRCWLKQGDEKIAYGMNRRLSGMLQKVEPRKPKVAAIYFGTLKAMKLQRSDVHLLGQTVVSFVDLLIKNLVTATLKADLQILQEELIFILTFLADPPMENATDDELTLVLGQIDVLLKRSWNLLLGNKRFKGQKGCWHIIFPLDKKDVSIKEGLHNFQRETETVNDRIRRLYCEFPHSSIYDFPKIIGRGFLDFLIRHLRNLKEKLISDTKCVPFAKKTIWKIEEELVSLRPIFNDISEMQKNKKELSDAWLRAIDLAYLTEHAVNSCFILDFQIWYHMAHLYDVLNRIKIVKTQLEKIKEWSVYNVGVLPCLGSSTSVFSKQAGTSDTDQVVVGFEEEERKIVDLLIWGRKSLDIVSIVGMPGLGKTTLARKVYGAPSVKRHFHVFAFCCVSQGQNAKTLLLDILSNLRVMDDVSDMTEHDLAHQLQKCLRGRRYLIVMDDMWEISVWNEVKSSFPDDQNGSRVVFTTRFSKVALEAQIYSSPYHLGFLPDEKSWELLQKKAFPNEKIWENLGSKFCDIGKLIAKNCKGLPLSVVVIAGVLAKTEPSLSWWSEIAAQTGSYLSLEKGFMDMLDFTYKHLPEYLKPLILYFGVFPEDTLTSVKSLMLLWIAEGFVHESKTKSLVDVAKDYLHDLVDRSLIIVTSRSSNGGVKAIGIHDLIHDFCRFNAQDENFFQVLSCSGASGTILSKHAGTSDISPVVVGFEFVVNRLIKALIGGHESLDIVLLVGMAGLGKTTVAKKVYDDPSVKIDFDMSAFCFVSRNHNVKSLLLDILSNFIVIDDVSSLTEDDLAHQLWNCLSGRKYLIVLDDIWEIRVWNEVKSSFPDDQNGSRVLFTTRFNEVANDDQIKYRHFLYHLSDEKSWELMQMKVFPNGSCPANISDVGKLIAKKCRGLPLSVVVIAGLLAKTEHNLSSWSEIADRMGPRHFHKGCMNIINLCYDYLPESLKPLLLCFGEFPEGSVISVKSLMLHWNDERFVWKFKTRSSEDAAKDYLHDLVDRNLIIVHGRSSNGGIETVRIHDLVHYLCRKEARAGNYSQLIGGNASSSSSHHPIHSHDRACETMDDAPSISSYYKMYNYRVCLQMAGETTGDVTPIFPCVRSLLSFRRHNDHFDTSSIIGKLKLVQVLHLDNMWLDEHDLEQISLLFHLRHVVAIVDHLVSVPSCISNLWALETFMLRTLSKGEVILPETIWEMKWLRHVNITRCRLTFPICQHEHEAYSQLYNVESFSSPTLSTGKQLQDLLQRLPAVRKLSCRFDKSCNSVDKRVETLDFLSRIESLNLAYIGDSSPYVIKFPSTLKKLKLVGFKLPWTAISDIGKLEHLEVLKLLWNSFVGPRCDMEDVVFPSLKFLKLNGLNLVHWNTVPDSFPCLEQLIVIGCEDLVEIPACFGVVLTLKKFEVHVCRKATNSAIQIKNDQMDFGNDTLEVDISYG